jgi:hypothetical protein
VPALLLVVVAAGCGSRTAPRAVPAKSEPSLQSLLGCLQRAGADAADVTTRDLRVSGGELGISFTSFHAYVGLAADHREAVAAAADLDRQVAVLQQAGRGLVRGSAVYYFDAPLVPRAGSHLVEACVAGSGRRASAAMAALAARLPLVQYPEELRQRVLARCRAVVHGPGCGCVYRRAARLFSYEQIGGLGRAWAPRRAQAVIAGLLATCERPGPVGRL